MRGYPAIRTVQSLAALLAIGIVISGLSPFDGSPGPV